MEITPSVFIWNEMHAVETLPLTHAPNINKRAQKTNNLIHSKTQLSPPLHIERNGMIMTMLRQMSLMSLVIETHVVGIRSP